jgi:hypothetical protein
VPWNPAVPPPPVAGATLGAAAVAGAGEVAGAVVVGAAAVAGEVSGAVGEVTEGVGEVGDVAGELSEGEDVGVGSGVVGDVVQAEITAEASMAKMPQPSAASLALSPVLAVVARPLMETPRKRRGP